jgi:phosphatidylinositol 4-kinase
LFFRCDNGSNIRLCQHLLLWTLVPPVTAISFFERRYRNDPFILQYAHRVLEQHPVDLTFFFVPQVVQALRYDDLGALSRLHSLPSPLNTDYLHRIRRQFHSRDCEDIPAIQSSDYLEYEGELLQR